MKKFDNVLFVGIGGGNDVFSCILAANCLKDIGWKFDRCDFAGVLSPFHEHTGMLYPPVPHLRFIDADSRRYVVRKDGAAIVRREISFVDASVLGAIRASRLADRQIGLSLEGGSAGLTRSFKALKKIYEYIVLVDVGGDCFYGGRIDEHVLSPMFDATVIQAFNDSGAEGILFEAGPGTDGELEPERIKTALMSCKAEAHRIRKETMGAWERLYRNHIEPVRPGRTVPTTIRAYLSKETELRIEYHPRAHIGKVRFYGEFMQTIDTRLCRKFFLLDPMLITRRVYNPCMVRSKGPIDWFMQTQIDGAHTNCEANLEYVNEGGRITQLLTPSPLLTREQRQTLITIGIADLVDGITDRAILLPDDWDAVQDAALEECVEIVKKGKGEVLTIQRTKD